MTTPAQPRTAPPPAAAAALLEEIADLKRVRAAHLPGGASWASDRFKAAWRATLACGSVGELDAVAVRFASEAVAAARLGAITRDQLRAAGLSEDAVTETFVRAVDEQAAAVEPSLHSRLRSAIAEEVCETAGETPWFVEALARQPRAGATCPGRSRYLLDPPENHAEHCFVVAVGGVLASAAEGCPPGRPFLFGLAHHLHNATLADSGFAGEVLLGDRLDAVLDGLFERAYADLPDWIVSEVKTLRAETLSADSPAARAFHTADVLDRVAEMRHFERAAAFAARTALHDLDLVHAGPTQAFGQQVLRDAGWWDDP